MASEAVSIAETWINSPGHPVRSPKSVISSIFHAGVIPAFRLPRPRRPSVGGYPQFRIRQAFRTVTGEGLEPSTNGLTYLIGFRQPSGATASDVESLDYPTAVAGVPRLVSGAGAADPTVPCLLITQSPAFSDPHACRCRRRCGVGGSQGVPAYCGIHSLRFGFFPREAPSVLPLKSVALPTELPGPNLIDFRLRN